MAQLCAIVFGLASKHLYLKKQMKNRSIQVLLLSLGIADSSVRDQSTGTNLFLCCRKMFHGPSIFLKNHQRNADFDLSESFKRGEKKKV